jgi:hypothetical protein
MDMHDQQAVAEAEAGKNMQQNDRIAAARQTNAEALVGRRPGRDKRRDPIREAIWGTVP